MLINKLGKNLLILNKIYTIIYSRELQKKNYY